MIYKHRLKQRKGSFSNKNASKKSLRERKTTILHDPEIIKEAIIEEYKVEETKPDIKEESFTEDNIKELTALLFDKHSQVENIKIKNFKLKHERKSLSGNRFTSEFNHTNGNIIVYKK